MRRGRGWRSSLGWATVGLLVSGLSAASEPEPLRWEIKVAGKPVGERTMSVSTVERRGHEVRLLRLDTTIDATVMGQPLQYRQKVDAVAGRFPASFHAVIDEAGYPRQLQVRYDNSGWAITRMDSRGTQTVEADPQRLAMSTVDLFDPATRYPLGRFEQVGILSAETGDVWQGSVKAAGHQTLRVGGRTVGVDGWVWKSPEGTHTFWYDLEGVLVRYETRVMGVKVEGVLSKAPPVGPDVFPVRTARAEVEVIDLG